MSFFIVSCLSPLIGRALPSLLYQMTELDKKCNNDECSKIFLLITIIVMIFFVSLAKIFIMIKEKRKEEKQKH